MTPRYSILRTGYPGQEWITCHKCGEIRSTANPCEHWVIDTDPHSQSTREHLVYGALLILSSLGLIGLFVW